jgi:hypothetical protein
VSCVNYFLEFKPSVMDGHRWFSRGNVVKKEGIKKGREQKIYYIYKDNLPSI